MPRRTKDTAVAVPPDWKLVDARTRVQRHIGDTVWIDRVRHVLVGGMPPAHASSTGYIYVVPAGQPPAVGWRAVRYYAQVARCAWVLRKGSITAKLWGKE